MSKVFQKMNLITKIALICICTLAISGVANLVKPQNAYASILFNNPSNGGTEWFDTNDHGAYLYHEKGTNHWTNLKPDGTKAWDCGPDGKGYAVNDEFLWWHGKDQCSNIHFGEYQHEDCPDKSNYNKTDFENSSNAEKYMSIWYSEDLRPGPGDCDYHFEYSAYDWDGNLLVKGTTQEDSTFDGIDNCLICDDGDKISGDDFYFKYPWHENIAYWHCEKVGLDD